MSDINICWIAISYVLGSMPFGYLITKLSTKKNIFQIGWRKSSGSNVFKNIGKWQGVLTGVLDVGKGFLAVRLAQQMNLSQTTQILSGVAAVTGHNWSCFMKFGGGRGIGTFVGAGLALTPKIVEASLILPVLLVLILNASIGTIVLMFLIMILSYNQNQFETAGLFTLISLIPIFLKRLSPIKEIEKAKNKNKLITNRLIFDDDISYPEPRIKRIIKKLTKK